MDYKAQRALCISIISIQRQHDYMDFGSHGFLFNVEFDRFGMIDLDLGFSDHIGLAIAGFLYGLKVL